MTKDSFGKIMDGAANIVGEAWNEARTGIVNDIAFKARLEERDQNLALAALALMDGGFSAEKTISLLQKHWDLRRSEALPYVEWACSKMEKTAK